jgi:hypothetical protein
MEVASPRTRSQNAAFYITWIRHPSPVMIDDMMKLMVNATLAMSESLLLVVVLNTNNVAKLVNLLYLILGDCARSHLLVADIVDSRD